MRHYFLLLLLGLFSFATSVAKDSPKDSLVQVLFTTSDAQKQIKILRNLADVSYKEPQEILYLKQLTAAAERSKDKSAWIDAMGDLANCYVDAMQLDSAKYYRDRIADVPLDTKIKCWLVYLELRLFDVELNQEAQSDAINKRVNESADKFKKPDNDTYARIEESYIIATSLYAQNRVKDALPYYDTSVELVEKLPLKDAFHLRLYILKNRERAYSVDSLSARSIQLIKEYSALLDTYYQQYIKKERPFFPIERTQLYNYVAILGNYQFLEAEDIELYAQKVQEISHRLTNPIDMYYKFLSLTCYYGYRNQNGKLLASIDSLLKYAEIALPYKVPVVYKIKSQIHEQLKEYPLALACLKNYYASQDSLTTAKSMEQLNELQVRYDFHKLNYDKAQLENRNKQVLLLFLCVILLISIGVSTMLYRNLKKEKMMKIVMNQLKNKAEESEKMKTAFINSVCHEIRTPLNAIVGFSDLLFDTSIDEETRGLFPGEIQRNTFQLTGLINSMLEVSNLDVSDEKLPCEPTDLNALCHREMELLLCVQKPEIHYHLHIPNEPLIISTHEQYLALVIENLLNNANKFTESGEIALTYQVNKEKRKLSISVTDTGIGIPLDKQEEVFERFTKLDTFKPGNGLGLYLCRLIIRRLSGEIGIDPSYTNGTRILITLPL